jgi:endonuclease YncB( thermonuclease family)
VKRQDLLKALQRALRGELRRARRRKGASPLLIIGLAIALFIVGRFLYEPTAPLPPKGAELACDVTKVYDGDTVTASCDQGRVNVRVYGIDAPEMGQEPWGQWSRDMLRNMVPAGKVMVRVMDIDHYGRAVAQLYVGDRDLGLEMLRQGGAVVYERYNKFRSYRTAQRQARRETLGVWSKPGAQQEPWEWRKLNPRG